MNNPLGVMIEEPGTGNEERGTRRVFLVSPWDETDPDEVRGAPDQAYLVRGITGKCWKVISVAPVEFRLPPLLRLMFFGLEIGLNALVVPIRGLCLFRRFGKPSLVICLDGKLAPGALVLSFLTGVRLVRFQHGIKDYLTRKNRFMGFLLNPDVPLNYWLPGPLFAVEDGSGAWALGEKRKVFIKLTQARPEPVPDVQKERAFVFCGRLHRIKGANRFIRVARRVRELVPSAVCVVIGAGPLSDDFGKESWIEMMGDLTHHKAIQQIARARVLCATAPYGNFTLPVLEAMSAGTVPVVFGIGWTGYMIRDAGVLISPFDEEAMAQGIARLLLDEEFFLEMSRRAIDRAKEFPSWQERTDGVIETLEALCSRSS
ncbi:MAG: glycosyltransferase family 4 protein [candidate division WOR-3 bacterium]